MCVCVCRGGINFITLYETKIYERISLHKEKKRRATYDPEYQSTRADKVVEDQIKTAAKNVEKNEDSWNKTVNGTIAETFFVKKSSKSR